MKAAYKNEIVSVVIPAYNNPEYTRKTIKSIVDQHYRPLEVVLSDDNSPTSLEPLAAEFKEYQSDHFRIRYFRQPTNLGMCDNFMFTVKQATGKYLIPLAHDNLLIDKNFISEAVEIMETNSECYMCVANAVYENTKKEMLNLPDNIKAKNSWEILEGDIFIRLWRAGGLGWTQAFVLDNQVAHSLGAFDEPFLVSGSLAKKLNLADDNVFAFVFVLSSIGLVALTGKVACEVGTPGDSYSRSDVKWKKTRSKVKFVVFYNIYKSSLEGRYAQEVREMAKKQAFKYIGKIFSFKIIRYYNYSFEIILLMGLSIIKKFFKKIRKQLTRANLLRRN
jgi:glycosyltransferase involved in cell wall biosynthesis